MKTYDNYDDEIAYSFEQLINIYRKNYFNAKDITDKETIMTNYIIDNQISNQFLQLLISEYSKKIKDNNTFLETILSYFHSLVYSLNIEQIVNIINIMNSYNLYINNEKFQFLMTHDPITNFKEIFNVYKNVTLKEQKETIIKKIDAYIYKMSQIIYDVELDNYYYSFKIFRILKNFTKKRVKAKFCVNKNKNEQKFQEYGKVDEKWDIYKQIYSFFFDTKSLFNKLNYNNIEKDIKILKIITFHLNLFEHSRNYKKVKLKFIKTINCLESNSITNKILDKYKLYRINNDYIITKDDWDKIDINEEIMIKEPFQVIVKIKHYNQNILDLDDYFLESVLKYPSIEYLSIDGLLNHSLIKYNFEIEEFSKDLLKYILASDKYINIFIRNDDRFDLNKEEEQSNEINDKNKNAKKIFESIFRGPNNDKIFDELWRNIFCIPF